MIEKFYYASPSVIQLLLEDGQTFAFRSTSLVGTIKHLRSALPSTTLLLRKVRHFFFQSFAKVTLSSVIQLVLWDDRAFAVRSTFPVGMIGHIWLCSPSMIQLQLGEDQAFVVKSTSLVETIRHLCYVSPLVIPLF